MPEFRKWIIALAVVALFAGLASAQVGVPSTNPPQGGQTAPTCTTTNGAVTPILRGEGFTEQVGDIIISCSGGSAPALGTQIPTANITLFLNTAVTSRLLQTTANGNASEALLMIDEPGSSLQGYGPAAPQLPCSSAAFGAGVGGCTEIVGTSTTQNYPGDPTPNVPVAGVPVLATCANGTTPCAPGPNVFQGIVSGNSVTFYGIPVLAPSTTGENRILRITNVRVNASALASASSSTPGSVIASLSTNGSNSLPIAQSTLTVGFVQQGLVSSVRNNQNTGTSSGINFNQCSSVSTAAAVGLQYQENFGTAFKVRTQGVQNIPGTIYNSESGFYMANLNLSSSNGVTETAGVADYGTRLKAVFSNVPSGVSIFVSTRDVTNDFGIAAGQTANAQLVVSETAPDSGTPPATSLPLASQTTTTPTTPFTAFGAVPISPVFVSGGTGTAVWEIVSANPSTIDTDVFAVYITYTASPATNSPSGAITVTMSFAPTPSPNNPFTATAGAAASNSLTIPRFSDILDTSKTISSFAVCQTDLLYPYVINTNGFDTGLAIANTSSDPFGTAAQVGTCTLNFYGSTAPAAAFTTPSVANGTVYANLASTLAPGFSGYIIAVCNFQYAHGFAFVSDVGARNLAMGYLALVMNNGSNLNTRGTSGENLNN